MLSAMNDNNSILLGHGAQPAQLLLRYANRHGLIAGATGTGKTVTLQTLAEGFSAAGVPVFLADVKGDLAGISQLGQPNAALQERARQLQLTDFTPHAFPTMFWDLLGTSGHPVRATVSDFGPLLLARLLELSQAQEGALNVASKIADDQGLLLLDLKDLRALLNHVSDEAKEYSAQYGLVSPQSIAAIQRQLLVLENQGVEQFLGEPALRLTDLIQRDGAGYGYINILAADKLIQQPRLYSMFLLWLLAELFEELPEVGDQAKPRMVFFFDEAHLLFKDAPPTLLNQVEQVVRLIRSKGVGVYFVTQNPLDIPDTILGQLSNRVQHALRAFTPRDQKAVRAAAETFRPNPAFKTIEVITELPVGYALVSLLDERGTPTPVDRVAICPPRSRVGPVTAQERQAILARSPVAGHYEQALDRHSAHEELTARQNVFRDERPVLDEPTANNPARSQRTATTRRAPASPVGTLVNSAVRAIGSQLGRQIVRGLLGALTKRL